MNDIAAHRRVAAFDGAKNVAKIPNLNELKITPGFGEKKLTSAGIRAIVDAHAGPPISVGVNRGRVVAGPIGSDRRRTYAVMGDTDR